MDLILKMRTGKLYHRLRRPDRRRMPKMPVGIDLFVRRCIEGGQLITAARLSRIRLNCQRDSRPTRLGVGACSGFGRSRSERVFRNEFPYLGRVDPAAWASFSPCWRHCTVGNVDRFRARRPSSRPRRRACGARDAPPRQGCARRLRRRPLPAPPGTPSRPRPGWRSPPAAAAGTAGPADLRALDQVLPRRVRKPAPSRSASPARTAASSRASPSSPPSSSSRKASRRSSCA